MDYKSAVVRLENDTFDVGAWSDPAKFSKLLRNIKNYIQKTYKEPDDIVKTIQQMKKADLAYPAKPKKDDPEFLDNSGNPDPDAFEMAVFAWKEDYKSMKYRMERYKGNKSNAWALIHDQCSPELKNKPSEMALCPILWGVNYHIFMPVRLDEISNSIVVS